MYAFSSAPFQPNIQHCLCELDKCRYAKWNCAVFVFTKSLTEVNKMSSFILIICFICWNFFLFKKQIHICYGLYLDVIPKASRAQR